MGYDHATNVRRYINRPPMGTGNKYEAEVTQLPMFSME